ncbi:MAG: cob(I)yrinic acid a,c-diamide adenosyltransferase [Myxococcales bacterium]|nr:cob(I)yrinic acid a,c-diamide adenosyltransferase [Myxococcales bacterium]
MAKDDREPFHAPHVTINRVYTKRGDEGRTSLVGGQSVDKDDLRIEAYGTVDELNAVIGAARVGALEGAAHPGAGSAALAELARSLLRVQHELFNLGSLLATLPEDLRPGQPRVTEKDVEALEREMDEATAELPVLRSFVLPGGSRLNADLHLARTVCRRAERLTVRLARATEVDALAVRYLNRLSDALFVWSRLACAATGADEVLWTPNASSTGASP